MFQTFVFVMTNIFLKTSHFVLFIYCIILHGSCIFCQCFVIQIFVFKIHQFVVGWWCFFKVVCESVWVIQKVRFWESVRSRFCSLWQFICKGQWLLWDSQEFLYFFIYHTIKTVVDLYVPCCHCFVVEVVPLY